MPSLAGAHQAVMVMKATLVSDSEQTWELEK